MRNLLYVAVGLVLAYFALSSGTIQTLHNGKVRAERAVCPQPVRASDRTLACDGEAVTTVRQPDGTVAVVTTTSPPPTARKP